jgi:hypothetical protein
VEFENREDFNHAYKNANQRKISGRRVVVDFERGTLYISYRENYPQMETKKVRRRSGQFATDQVVGKKARRRAEV